MRTRTRCAAFALLILFSQAAVPSPATPLQALTPWDLNYGEAQCLALRNYGDSADPVTFAIRPALNGASYEILVSRKRAGPMYAQEHEGSVDFGSGPIKAWLLHYQTPRGKLTIDQYRISASDMAAGRTANLVTLRSAGRGDVAFSLANMAALIKGLEDCTTDLRRYWNEHGEDDGSIAFGATGDVRKIFTNDDYPDEALRRGQQGTSQFYLLIDEHGKVAGCNVLKPSGIPALDGMGCSVIIERAKFSPALDRNRKPVRSTYVTPPIVWAMPG